MSANLHQLGAWMNPRQPRADVTQPEWLDLKTLTLYACVSERTLRQWIHRPVDALPAVRVGSKILIRRSVFDLWLENHRLKQVDVGCIVDEMIAGVTGTA
jgi:excisionase family DNA binding protein